MVLKRTFWARFLLVLLVFVSSRDTVLATDYSSTNFIIRDPVTSIEGGRSTSTSFEYYSSTGLSVAGSNSSLTFQQQTGFLYYEATQYIQNAFRFYNNLDALTPTASLANENASAQITEGNAFRLRIGVDLDGDPLLAGQNIPFTLQYAELGSAASCSAVTSSNFQDVTGPTGATLFRAYDNASLSDGASLSSVVLTTSNVAESYEENGSSTTPPRTLYVGQNIDGEWDWSLSHNGDVSTATAYCFRLVRASTTLFNTYSRFPTLTVVDQNSSTSTGGGGGTGGSGSSGGGGGGGGSDDDDDDDDDDDSAASSEVDAGAGGGLSVQVSGWTYPNSTVVILKDGQMLGEVEVEDDGSFSTNITDLTEGLYNFTFYSINDDGEESNLYLLPTNIGSDSENIISNMVLPPTLLANKSEVTQGEELILSGTGAPLSPVMIVLESTTQDLLVESQTDENGNYFIYLGTDVLEKGTYTIYSRLQHSENSKSIEVTVGSRTVFVDESLESPAGDFNGDGRVNLIDFSILAYWYEKDFSSSEDRTLDMDSDGEISISDFSLLSYNWTG